MIDGAPIRRLVVVLAVALASVTGHAFQVDVPANDGWVTDLAELLDAREERELEALMESYRQGSGHEIALLTIPSLDGRTIERFALEVGREWGIGREGEHDGALLVVARDERRLRIEVGRGLEGSVTDAIAGRIISDVITPSFKAGDFGGGLRAGVEALHAAAGGDYAVLEQRARSVRNKRESGSAVMFFVVLVIMIALRGGRGGRGGGGGGGGGGWLAWWLASSAWSSSHHRRGGQWSGTGGFGGGGGGFGGGGFGGFGGGGGFSGGGASGGW